MKKLFTPTLFASLLTLTNCAEPSEDDGTNECLEYNLHDVSDIVDAADNTECDFTYDIEEFEVKCPASTIRTLRIDDYFVIFNDENNGFDFDRNRMLLNCGYDDFILTDPDELEFIQERLRMKFSFLPIPD